MNSLASGIVSLRSKLVEKVRSVFQGHQVPVLLNRLGLDGGPLLSLEVHGDHLGVTRERVRQMEMRAIKLLSTEVIAKYFDLEQLGALHRLDYVFADIDVLLREPVKISGSEVLLSAFFKNILLNKDMHIVEWSDGLYLTDITETHRKKIAAKHRELTKGTSGRNAGAVDAMRIINALGYDFKPCSVVGEWFLSDMVCLSSGKETSVYGLRGRLGSYFGQAIGAAYEPMSVDAVVSSAQVQMSLDGFVGQDVLASTAENWLRDNCHLIYEGHFGLLSAFGVKSSQMNRLAQSCANLVQSYPEGFEFPAGALYEKLNQDLLFEFAQGGCPVTKFTIQAALLEANVPSLEYLGRGVFMKRPPGKAPAQPVKRLVLSDLAVEMLESNGSPLQLSYVCDVLGQTRQGDFKQISDHNGRLFAPSRGLLGLKCRDRDVPIRDFMIIERIVGELESMGADVFEKDLCGHIIKSGQLSEVTKGYAEKGDLSQLVTFGPFLRRNSTRRISVRHGSSQPSRQIVIEGLSSFEGKKFSFEQLVSYIEARNVKISRPDLKYWLETHPAVHGAFASGELGYLPIDDMDPWFGSLC